MKHLENQPGRESDAVESETINDLQIIRLSRLLGKQMFHGREPRFQSPKSLAIMAATPLSNSPHRSA
jgi:hypothetical protein